jgi:hypothetical protein
MGEVHLTMNQALAAPCVIKTLKPEAAERTSGLRARFVNEPKVLARIRHQTSSASSTAAQSTGATGWQASSVT